MRRPPTWEATMAEVKARLPHVRSYAGRLGEGPRMVAAWMDEYQALMRDSQRLAMYAFLGSATDARRPDGDGAGGAGQQPGGRGAGGGRLCRAGVDGGRV